jgi:hypothetical protein
MVSLRSLAAKDQFTKYGDLSRVMADDPSRFAAAANDTALARAALKEVGLDVPEGVEIRLHRNDSREIHFAIPTDPNAEVSEAELEAGGVSGGFLAAKDVLTKFTKLAIAMAADPSRFDAASKDSALARDAVREVGIDPPDGVEIRLLRNDSRVFHFAIPANPNAEMTTRELEAATGISGAFFSTVVTVSTFDYRGRD